MKYTFFRLGSGIVIIVILAMGFLIKPQTKLYKPSGGKGFAIVELFTSEGCSSCPAADAEVEKISALHPDDVYALGFHVDYWNRLGWKDEFSDAAYSKRQQGYAEHFNLNGVYTPQVVVNGKLQLVGSDDAGIQRSIAAEIENTVNQPIELTASTSPDNNVRVNYKFESQPANSEVNIALVQKAAQTNVKRGENEGRLLHHINIVRDFKTMKVTAKTGTVNLVPPTGVNAKECKVILYLQQLQTREITSVTSAPIQ